MEAHLIFVAAAEGLGELACLICKYGAFNMLDFDDDVLLFWLCWGHMPVNFVVLGMSGGLGGAHALTLTAHVSPLGLLRLEEAFVHVLEVDEGTGKIVSLPDGFEPGGFRAETGGGMKVASRRFQAGGLVYMVDGFAWWGAFPHGLDVRAHGTYIGDALERLKGLLAVRAVKEESISVQVGDISGKWHVP